MQMQVPNQQCAVHGLSTPGEHEEQPGLDLIKYGTTNLAPIKFTVQVSHKYSILCAV